MVAGSDGKEEKEEREKQMSIVCVEWHRVPLFLETDLLFCAIRLLFLRVSTVVAPDFFNQLEIIWKRFTPLMYILFLADEWCACAENKKVTKHPTDHIHSNWCQN